MDKEPPRRPQSSGLVKTLETDESWDDLNLPAPTLERLERIVDRYEKLESVATMHGKTGFGVLFHGPPCSGKTRAAAVLGQRIGAPVHRLDFSLLSSKYIGETEKNLIPLFDQAVEMGAILLIVEADPVFGACGNGRNANDENQHLSDLLQRLETYPGLVVLCANELSGIPPAAARRCTAIISFARQDPR